MLSIALKLAFANEDDYNRWGSTLAFVTLAAATCAAALLGR